MKASTQRRLERAHRLMRDPRIVATMIVVNSLSAAWLLLGPIPPIVSYPLFALCALFVLSDVLFLIKLLGRKGQ